MDRREFLRSGSAALIGLSSLPLYAEQVADRRRRVGLIGCGWYGKCDLFRLLQVAPVEVASLCDVDAHMLDDAARQVSARQASRRRPRTFRDYREMLAEKDLDIVLVATPDHWHALPAIEAIRSGAHVYVQKPTAVDVVESQAMLAAARKYGRVVQVGTQRRSTPHLARARDTIVREGRLGTIGLVEIYCYYPMRSRANPTDVPPPAHLDWERWTGPAPMRPYNPMVHPRGWRNFMEYSNGIVGDMCVHMLDMVRWMMDLGAPARITSSGGVLVQRTSRANTTDTQTVTFEFGDLPIVWTHRTWGSPPDPKYPWAATLYGDRGTLKASVMSWDFVPSGEGRALHEDVTYELDKYPEDRSEKDLELHAAPANRAHMIDFLSAIDNNGTPVADIEQGHISSAACILGNISQELGRSLDWDAAAGRVRADEEANGLLRRPYRAPWIHPEVDTV